MANQEIPSTPEGSPPATIANVVASQWRKGSCENIPAPSFWVDGESWVDGEPWID